MSKLASDDAIEQVRELVKEGDISLTETRLKYTTKTGQTSTLDDEELLEAIAATDDDDDELLITNMLKIEHRKSMSAEKKPAA